MTITANTSIDQTPATITSVDTAIEQHTTSSRRGLARKALASLLVGLVGIIGVVGFESGAVNAQGSTPGGGWYDARITCNASRSITPSTVTIAINLHAQRGYASQRVAYRYWTTDGRTSGWTGWYTANVGSFPNGGNVFHHEFNVPDGGSYHMYVEVMWSNGQRWTESVGFWADKYQRLHYWPTLSPSCTT